MVLGFDSATLRGVEVAEEVGACSHGGTDGHNNYQLSVKLS